MVDPTNDGPRHPLTNAPVPRVVPDTTQIPIRYRPRFTMTEALILNLLVNAAPEMVSMDELRRRLGRYSLDGIPIMESSIKQAIVGLRAKLGEKAWEPKQVISVRVKYFSIKAGYEVYRIVGYKWVDPYDA